MIRTEEEHLAHYGILRKSGRYPWGSGDTQTQRNKDYLTYIANLRKEGMTDTEIAKSVGVTRTELHAARTIARAEQKQSITLQVQRHVEDGWSNVEIGARMGMNESSIRAIRANAEKDKEDVIQTTTNMLKEQLDKKGMVDVGTGVGTQLGIGESKLKTAVAVMKEQGYVVHPIYIEQIGTGKFTTMQVLAPRGTKPDYINKNRALIQQVTDHSIDHGRSYLRTQPPINISSKRLGVRYKEDGGDALDGVIHVRPGVKDLSIGQSRYAQVRIAVDGTHYLKGMAVYKEDLPPGIDLVFNTNKSKEKGWKTDSNKMKDDPDNPFGAIIRQVHGPDGKVSSAMNLVGSPTKEGSGEEGQWDNWSRNLSSQMLSKQSPTLAKTQLNMTYERRLKEFNEINSLTNPTVRKELLIKFADSTDSAAVHLQAANLPRQATKVLLPIPSMKPTEIYAPSMRDGERVVLVRFPHGGTFEIPELTVNNKNRDARRTLGTAAKDAVGVHHKVAERLSGADFDGDTVLVIPNNRRLVKTTPALEGLKGFDPMVYKIPDGSPIPRINNARKQREMGKVSNLITDMTIGNANTTELAQAIRHSMVVIDSEKHGLDWKQSEKDNNIKSLKQKYQYRIEDGKKKTGAATLISRAGAQAHPLDRRERSSSEGGPIDPLTGKKVYTLTGKTMAIRKTMTDPATGQKRRMDTGKVDFKRITSKQLAETDDAFTLSSGTQIETIYAEHSNKLKALANASRKEAVAIKPPRQSKTAKKVYSAEVESINSKLKIAQMNAPRERQAQLVAQATVSQKRQAHPNMEKSEVTKIKQLALNDARIRTGAKKDKIKLTQEEWNAIQAGAISNNILEKVLNNSDIDTVKRLAMPKDTPKMTATMTRRAQQMLADGYTQADVADHLGISVTTLKVGIE